MQKIFIFPNFKKKQVKNILEKLLEFFSREKIKVVLPDSCASFYNTLAFSTEKQQGFQNVRLAIALGGDGTILHLLKEIGQYEIPICGINMGQVGFLAELKISDLDDVLIRLCQSKYLIEQRKMLKLEVWKSGKVCWVAHVLNDIVLARNQNSQMLRVNVAFSSSEQIKYPVDGLIFSTATGSTAYSLSAGGPIVHPNLEATVITPICAYAMYTKPLVISTKENLLVQLANNSGSGSLSTDGISLGKINRQYTLKIVESEYQARFIRFNEANYYPTWQGRLRRGEASTNF